MNNATSCAARLQRFERFRVMRAVQVPPPLGAVAGAVVAGAVAGAVAGMGATVGAAVSFSQPFTLVIALVMFATTAGMFWVAGLICVAASLPASDKPLSPTLVPSTLAI